MKISIGAKLKMARVKKGLKQVEVCKILNMPNSTLSNYERDVREPDLSTLVRFAELYDVSTDYFLDREETNKRWSRFLQSSDSPTNHIKENITDYELEFLKDARKIDFDFLKWQYLTEEQKDIMFRVVRNVIMDLYKEKKNKN